MASQQPRPMFGRYGSMYRPAAAPQPEPPAAAPQPAIRPPMATPFRSLTTTAPPQTSEPTPPHVSAPAASAPPPPQLQPAAPSPAATTILATKLTSSDPPSPTHKTSGESILAVPKSSDPISQKLERQDSSPPLQPYQAPKPATSSRSPPPSPKNVLPHDVKAPNQYSTKIPPVSPLKLPPSAQVDSEIDSGPRIPAEIDQKTVVVQETSERNQGVPEKINGTQRYDTSDSHSSGKREAMMTKDKDNSHHHHKKPSDSYKPSGTSILTLTGENKGAMMELSPMSMKNKFIGSPRKLNGGEKQGEESHEEGKSGIGAKNNGMESLPMTTAFMNSNVQGLNNSIIHNASFSHHDPGVHFTFSRKSARCAKKGQRLND